MANAFDWKKLVGGIAPVLGTALLGPLGGMAVKVLAGAVLGNPEASEAEVAAALSSGQLTGEQIVAIKTAGQDFDVRMKSLDIDIMKVNQAGEAALIADTSDARHTFGGNENVFVLGCLILATFGCLMAAELTGCFLLMTGYFHVDSGTAAICSGMIGTVTGYLASNAQQVVSFFYGSSKGSKDNGDRIGAALTESIKQAGAK